MVAVLYVQSPCTFAARPAGLVPPHSSKMVGQSTSPPSGFKRAQTCTLPCLWTCVGIKGHIECDQCLEAAAPAAAVAEGHLQDTPADPGALCAARHNPLSDLLTLASTAVVFPTTPPEQSKVGNKWSEVAKHIPGRTGQQCAQRWRHKVTSA